MSFSYFLRITPKEPLSFEDVEEMLSQLHIDQYFICYEEASRPHYHLCLFSERGVENLRYRIKSHINGQVYLSGRQIEDKVRAVAYCMKDGKWRQKNMDVHTMLMATATTHKKEKFEDDLKVLIEDKESSIRDIIKRLIDLHIKYNRKIYRQHIKALVELIRAKRCPDYRQKLIDYFLDDY